MEKEQGKKWKKESEITEKLKEGEGNSRGGRERVSEGKWRKEIEEIE